MKRFFEQNADKTNRYKEDFGIAKEFLSFCGAVHFKEVNFRAQG